MSSDIVLGAATRQNLLSLQGINSQINTSESHLATGLKVASAVDNAVSFFQAQSLTNRANDLLQRKDNIDQAISSLTTATQAAQSVVSILQQLQGVINAAKTQTGAQLTAAGTQFSTLLKQLNNLVGDASYQGLNLVNSSTSTLTVQFSLTATSVLKVTGSNLNASGIIKFNSTLAGANFSAIKLSAGSANLISAGTGLSGSKSSVGKTFSTASNLQLNAVFNTLQNAITTVQGDAQSLGGNVTLLQTRLSFSSAYATTLQGGSDKLTLADVNQESTNLVTLQTRQQLSIQSLSIATQSEQAVLRLFH
ncbi:MAG TPA: flagellin [Stellaceae bacterium]|nr:flagellin [Stellaceae bacterium]